MIGIAILVVLTLFVVAMMISLGRLAIRETRRSSHQTSFQQRYIRDGLERSQWQMFTIALSSGTLPQLQENLK